MGLMACHECGAVISSEAKACPHCGARPKSKIEDFMKAGCLLIVIAIAIGSYIGWKASPEGKMTEAERKCIDTSMAFVMSTQFVKDKLRAPATADFPYSHSEGVKTKYLGDCTHEIYGYVDAQNSFGAKIRNKYYAKLKNQMGTDSWSLLDISIGD
jgi:hypothetical protein